MTAEELREMELDPDADSLESECDNLGADMTLSQATLPPLSQFVCVIVFWCCFFDKIYYRYP
jgi:hypothetical protein